LHPGLFQESKKIPKADLIILMGVDDHLSDEHANKYFLNFLEHHMSYSGAPKLLVSCELRGQLSRLSNSVNI
jgi:hypothetical protein